MRRRLDYFGARYMSAAQGRFTSPDPTTFGVEFGNPQSWNKYGYALHNPLAFVDRNGLWPTWIHDQIIKDAFPGLSALAVRTLQNASRDTDWGYTINGHSPQDPQSSFVHGMTDGVHGQNPLAAEGLGDVYINEQETDARQIQAEFQMKGESALHLDALTAFGRALHTVQDRTSPAHEGNQVWMGTDGTRNRLRAAQHFNSERTISPQRLNLAVQASRNAFRQTFGDALYLKAIGQTPPSQGRAAKKKEQVTVTIRYGSIDQ